MAEVKLAFKRALPRQAAAAWEKKWFSPVVGSEICRDIAGGRRSRPFASKSFLVCPWFTTLTYLKIPLTWALLFYYLAIFGEVLLCLPAVFLLTFPSICSMN
ncbi:hypothetical protein EK904_015090 [Melospiza melodia maxima]|nr:hypothetical protein EK904_015090 [Melospiza melodia maxima]